MKIERISDSIIRVTISLDDLLARNIDLNSLNCNSAAAQEFFWELMEEAEMQLGFSLSNSQLIIEPVANSNDSFVITITRIDEDSDFESIHKYIKNKLKKSDLRIKKRSRRVCSPLLVYSFKTLDDVCGLASILKDLYCGDNTLYKCKNTYFLTLSRSGLAPAIDYRSFELKLSEYGVKVPNANYYEGYLNEYGEIIIDGNAISLLGQYF